MSNKNDKTTRSIVKGARDAIVKDYLVRNWPSIKDRAIKQLARERFRDRLSIAVAILFAKPPELPAKPTQEPTA